MSLKAFKNKDGKNIRGMAYDGSVRVRPKGKENKTVGLHLNKKNAQKLMFRLADFVESDRDLVYITAHKDTRNDDGMSITVTSPTKAKKKRTLFTKKK
jgi:hypothetical protein